MASNDSSLKQAVNDEFFGAQAVCVGHGEVVAETGAGHLLALPAGVAVGELVVAVRQDAVGGDAEGAVPLLIEFM